MRTFSDDKDPDSVKEEFGIDWSADLALSSPADTISSSSWSADNGLTVVSNSVSGGIARVKVSGGRLGAYCNLTNHIVCASGYEDDGTIVLEIKQK